MPDDSALLFMFIEGLKPDMQMLVLLACPTILVECEKSAKYADMAHILCILTVRSTLATLNLIKIVVLV